MPVIVVGQPKDAARVVCPGCGYELQYRRSDVRLYRHAVDGEGYIQCPRGECKKIIDIPPED